MQFSTLLIDDLTRLLSSHGILSLSQRCQKRESYEEKSHSERVGTNVKKSNEKISMNAFFTFPTSKAWRTTSSSPELELFWCSTYAVTFQQSRRTDVSDEVVSWIKESLIKEKGILIWDKGVQCEEKKFELFSFGILWIFERVFGEFGPNTPLKVWTNSFHANISSPISRSILLNASEKWYEPKVKRPLAWKL